MKKNRSIRILGTRGVPAQHGGFETFAEYLSLYLADKGWDVTVYCQEDGKGAMYTDEWRGVKLIHYPITQEGVTGTIIFDWKTTLHAAENGGLILTLGYNTAIFCLLYRFKGLTNFINMDGLEWKRDKWSTLAKLWLYVNERAGCLLGNQLIADHPQIKEHLATRIRPEKITMIPYGAERVDNADVTLIHPYGLQAGKYAIMIARPEPENSILEIVTAFSSKTRSKKLVVLGDFDKVNTQYREKVFAAASDEVVFLGAIYEQAAVSALRFFSCLYLHGHQVGGTNPSLVEALGAGNPILAHDNKFNRWVAGDHNHYFNSIEECEQAFSLILEDRRLRETISSANHQRHLEMFTWENILGQYLRAFDGKQP
jgi:glycosyltransferase involved in cell wall biosynthesis